MHAVENYNNGAYSNAIAGWEVGNEPNLSYQYLGDNTYYTGASDPDTVSSAPRYYVVGLDNAENYARYLASVSESVASVEQALGKNIILIGAGIGHNDYAYMDRMFTTLEALDANVDAFSIHPYTMYDYPSPQSGRPTDWVPTPDGTNDTGWNYYHNFQQSL